MSSTPPTYEQGARSRTASPGSIDCCTVKSRTVSAAADLSMSSKDSNEGMPTPPILAGRTGLSMVEWAHPGNAHLSLVNSLGRCLTKPTLASSPI